MPYLILNQDNSIADVVTDDPGNGIEVTYEQLGEINASTFGHSVFDYVGNAIRLNQSRNLQASEVAESAKLRKTLIDRARDDFINNSIQTEVSQINGMSLAELKAALGIGQ